MSIAVINMGLLEQGYVLGPKIFKPSFNQVLVAIKHVFFHDFIYFSYVLC